MTVVEKQYVNHSLTLGAEPICGAQLIPPEAGQREFVDCPDCEKAIGRMLDTLARVAP